MVNACVPSLLSPLEMSEPLILFSRVSVKIQTLRGTFRDEIRKVKESRGTGSGADEVYVPKWKFFNQCLFMEGVLVTELMTVSNVTRSASPANSEASQVTTEDADNEVDTPPALRSPEGQVKNCKRKRGPQWMENAATALANLASTAQEVEEEWDIFGKDVAMTIRNMDVAQTKKALCSRLFIWWK